MPIFKRDSFTWLAYCMLAFYACLQAGIGPLLPFLRAELDLSYTVAGLHPSAFALGMVLAGFLIGRARRRLDRRGLFSVGGSGMAAGTALLIAGSSSVITISAAFVMGFLGSWLLVTLNASLADKHGPYSGVALTEANALASFGAALISIMIGGFEDIGLGWRFALIAAILYWLGLYVWLRRVQVPPRPMAEIMTAGDAHDERLPRAFWPYWLLFLFVVSVEWCVIYWAAEFLTTEAGISPATASTAVGAFFVANIASRLTFSRMARTVPNSTLLLAALGVALIGFPIFWLAQTPVLNVLGLTIAGFGIGSLYPTTLSTAVALVGDAADMATARISIAVGFAMLITPQVLAYVADLTGLFNAYAIAGGLLVASLAVAVVANKIAAEELVAEPVA